LSCLKSKGLTPSEHAMVEMKSALLEYFFYPPKLFENRRELFRETFEHFGLSKLAPFDSFMPTWAEYFRTYWGRDPVFIERETGGSSLEAASDSE